MKKIVLILVLISVATFGFAQEKSSNFSIDLGIPVITMGFPPLPEDWPEEYAVMAMLLTLRGGAYLDFMFNLNNTISFGAESGAYFMPFVIFGEEEITELYGALAMEIPVRAFARFTFGAFSLQPYGGVIIPVLPSGGNMNFEVGGRLGLGKKVKFFVEGGYLFGSNGNPGYPKAGLGLLFNLINF